MYLIQSGRRHAEAASTHNVNCKLLSGKEEDLESSDVFISAVLSCPNDETAFCRINAARREVRSGGELHKGPPQQHRHQPRQRERDPCVSGRWVLPDMGVQGDVRQPSRVVSLNRDVIPQKPLPRSSRIQFIFRSQDQPSSSSITTTTTTRPMRCSAVSLQGTGYYRDYGYDEDQGGRYLFKRILLVFHQPRQGWCFFTRSLKMTSAGPMLLQRTWRHRRRWKFHL